MALTSPYCRLVCDSNGLNFVVRFIYSPFLFRCNIFCLPSRSTTCKLLTTCARRCVSSICSKHASHHISPLAPLAAPSPLLLASSPSTLVLSSFGLPNRFHPKTNHSMPIPSSPPPRRNGVNMPHKAICHCRVVTIDPRWN